MIIKKILRNKWKLFLVISFHLSSVISFSQVNRAPAYPLVVHDPYFSIWSFSDKLNESTTKHWTGTDQSLMGFLSVDGKIYKFLGNPPRELKAVVADADMAPYNCQFTETKPAGDWTSIDYDDSKWQTGKGLFGTKNMSPQTEWSTREIWIRRIFDIQSNNFNELVL